MRIVSLILLISLVGIEFAHSDQEAANAPYVSVAMGGRCYAKSIPSTSYGNEGETKVYQVMKGNDVLIGSYNWFSNPVYLHCGLGRDKYWGISLVKFGPWNRGSQPSEKDLAMSFYFSDSLVKSHSTLEIAGRKDNSSRSVSHYTVIDEVLGYRWIKENEYVFEITTIDAKVVTFDPITGAVLSSKEKKAGR